jgi:plastocyanin
VAAVHAAVPHTAAATAQTRTVIAGFGDRDGAANVFAPKVVDIYAGDTVTWRLGGALEPHTISFGPRALLQRLAEATVIPVPQRSEPPQVQLNPQVAFPSGGRTYSGSGFVSSGLLRQGQSWSLTFPTPGVYHFHCLIHYPAMSGTVVVHARPTAGTLYHVIAGDSLEQAQADPGAATDAFFPRHLTIHVGDTVSWNGTFHTVAFGPDAERTEIERHLILARRGADGRPVLYLNPRAVDPSGGTTYDGTGFVNSGLLFLRARNGPPEYRLTFTRPGTYEYACLIHPHMEGTITVLPRGAS